MQQIALPSLYQGRRPVVTQPFPLVRRAALKPPSSSRRFFSGLLFGLLMSMTLVLLGYEARMYSDAHPGAWQSALQTVQDFRR